MSVPFVKMSGAGNDMILVDHREKFLHGREADFSRAVCDRRFGVGADGVVLLQEDADGTLRARFFNPDGREYGLCGNGARCVPPFAAELGYSERVCRFRSGESTLEGAVVREGFVRVQLPPLREIRLDLEADLDGEVVRLDWGLIADPHAVCWVEDPSAVPVADRGARLRSHAVFGPEGSNVSFARVHDPRRMEIRTFERGVEGETLACGSGSTVAAAIARARGLVEDTVQVVVRSGDTLTVHLPPAEGQPPVLEGPVSRAFQGRVDWIGLLPRTCPEAVRD